MRRTTIGMLPESVRLRMNRGDQASDILERIQLSSDQTHSLLEDIKSSFTAHRMLDTNNMYEFEQELLKPTGKPPRQKCKKLLFSLATGAYLKWIDSIENLE